MPKVRRWAALLAVFAIVQGLVPVALTQPARAETSIPPAPFADVYSTKYQDAVGLLYLLKVATGTAPYSFSPNDKVTRAQMAAFLLRTLGEIAPESAAVTFTDVSSNHWAATVIARAAELGLIRGDGTGHFRPEAPVTYGEVITMLIRALGYEGQVPPGDWPVNYVLMARDIGLLANSDFQILESATRGEVAILLANAIFKAKEASTGKPLNARVFQSIASIRIEPASEVITASQMQLTLMGTDWFGNSFPVTGTWTVLSANASISQGGLLTVTGLGSVSVQGARGERVISQTFTRVQSLAVTPTGFNVPVGGTVQFSAKGVTAENLPVPVTVRWTATGPGNIDVNTGLLTVTGSGPITVTASAAGISATASVTGVTGLSISPTVTMASLGQTIQFQATAAGGTQLGVPVSWTIISGGGSLDKDGRYTPGAAGHVVIQAAAGSLTAKTEFDVVTGMRIEPASAVLGLGTTQQFVAQIQSAGGWKTVDSVVWSLSNTNIGVMSSAGLLATTGSGMATITARSGNLVATSTVTVAGPAAAMRLTSTQPTLPANGSSTTTLTATFVDSGGIATSAPVSQVLFTLSDLNLGTLSTYSAPVVNNQATVTWTSGTVPTTGLISVSAPGSSVAGANLSVSTVAPTLVGIQLSAYPSKIAADGTSRSTVTATLIDQDGQPMTNNTGSSVNVSLGASGSAGSLLTTSVSIAPGTQSASVQFQAAASPGTSTITGAAPYAVTATQVSAAIVGPAAKLNIRAPITDTVADGSKQMSVIVEVQDANGNVVTGDNINLVSLTVSGPAGITPGSLTVSGGTATFKLQTTKAGTYTLIASSATNANLTSARTTANFVAGAPSSLGLALSPNVNAVSADGVTAVNLAASILDAYGNLVTTATNPVTFTQNSATVFRSFGSQTVNAQGGIATISITPSTSVGSDQIMASAPGLTAATLTVSTQITGGANKVVVRTPSPTTAISGQTITVSVWVEDSAGHVVTSDSGRNVALVLSDPSATSNSPQRTVNGVATFTVTPAASGTLSIKAQSGALLADTVGAIVSVTPAPADHIVLKASATSLAADGTSTVVVTPQIVDVYGNPVGAVTAVTLSLNNSTVGRLAATQISTGYGDTFTASTIPGTVTISGTAQYPVVPVTLKTYIYGQPTRVVVDPPQNVPAGTSQMQVTVRVTDNEGNTVTNLNSAATTATGPISVAYLMATTGGSGTTTLSSTASYPLPPGVPSPNGVTTAGAWLVRGVATFTFMNTKAETVTFTPALSIGNQLLTPVGATGTFTEGNAVSVAITSSPAALNALTGGSVTVTANLVDAYGNAVSSAGDNFTFALSSTVHLIPPSSLTVTAGTAGASITLQPRTNAASITLITATSTNTGLTSASYSLVQDFQPDRPSVTISSVNGSGNFYSSDAAVRVTLYFNSRLLSQTVTVYVNGVQVPFYSDVSGLSAVPAVSPGYTSVSGYILRSSYGGTGPKTVSVVLQNAVGTGQVSNSVTFTVQ